MAKSRLVVAGPRKQSVDASGADRWVDDYLRLLAQVKGFARRSLDFVVPPSCPVCQVMVQNDGGLCSSCWQQITWIDGPICNRLGTPLSYDLGPGAVSAEALANPPEFDRLRAVCTHDGLAPQLVHALKFGKQRHLAKSLGAMMARAGKQLLTDQDSVLVPVPLHPWRQVQRGFNQSALLAQSIGSLTGVSVEFDAIKRTRGTRQQVSLSRGDRLRNMRGAFKVAARSEGNLAGKHVILVDDVHTTGATLNALAKALLALPSRARPACIDAMVFSTAVVRDGTNTI